MVARRLATFWENMKGFVWDDTTFRESGAFLGPQISANFFWDTKKLFAETAEVFFRCFTSTDPENSKRDQHLLSRAARITTEMTTPEKTTQREHKDVNF